MLAEAYRSQVRLGYLRTAQQNRYLNEELGQNIRNIQEQTDAIVGSQYTAMAGSGFTDVSTGDKRLVAETERKGDIMSTNANREAYLQSFEMFREANLNAIYLNAQANMADIAAKSTSGWRGFTSALSSAGLSALGAYASFAQPSGKAKNVDVAGGRGYQGDYSEYEFGGKSYTTKEAALSARWYNDALGIKRI